MIDLAEATHPRMLETHHRDLVAEVFETSVTEAARRTANPFAALVEFVHRFFYSFGTRVSVATSRHTQGVCSTTLQPSPKPLEGRWKTSSS